MDDLSGQEIRGYTLIERIGEGGFGVVYRAEQPAVDREVAIKVILPEFADHPEFVQRFEAELLDWFRTRESGLLNEVRSTGAIGDEDGFKAAVQAFADQFQPSVHEVHEPDAEAQGEAHAIMVDSDTTLPEQEITRDED